MISKRYGVRHVILQNIASVTTKRLQGIRRTLNIADLKKKQITRERLVTYLSTLDSPLLNFRDELSKLLNKEQLQVAYSIFAAEYGIDPSQVSDYLTTKIAKVYVDNKVYQVDKNAPPLIVFQKDEKKIASYEKCYKKLISCMRSCKLIEDIIFKITKAETPEYRGLLYKQVFSLCAPYTTKFNEVKAATDEQLALIIKSMSTTVSYFETLTNSDVEICGWFNNFCDMFEKEYSKTSKTNTLPKAQDEPLRAFVLKMVDSGRASTFFKK
jgi:hypothetical protein